MLNPTKPRRKSFFIILAAVIMLVSCTGDDSGDSGADIESGESLPLTDTSEPASSDENAEIEETDVEERQPTAVQTITFTAEDGPSLTGKFYPSEQVGNPLIILMHWAPGDQEDWKHIAPWLQNTELENPETGDSEQAPWLDTAWFPEIPQDLQFNVFTFTFRSCEGGCSRFEREKWFEDVKAAVDTAAALDGVDNSRIIMIGASIGSDGAVDGCAYLNEKSPGTCLGAMALSPGNYLMIDFEEMVKALDPTPVWCLYAETDPESAGVCSGLESENYSSYAYPADKIYSNGHGMNLIEENQEPNPLDLMIQFFRRVL